MVDRSGGTSELEPNATAPGEPATAPARPVTGPAPVPAPPKKLTAAQRERAKATAARKKAAEKAKLAARRAAVKEAEARKAQALRLKVRERERRAALRAKEAKQPSKKVAPKMEIERELWERGFDVVVGIDEVGRGAWAGPLTVGAAILPRDRRVNGVRDSKLLTEDEREAIFGRVASWCEAWAVGSATQEECDELGMAAAQRLAAQRAIDGLGVTPDAAVVDGKWNFVAPHVPHVELRIKADARCLSVAAASILAKVTRDREMRTHAEHYPHWHFDTNKGYPCPLHKTALQGYGPSAIHRRTWVFMDNYVPYPGMRVFRPEQPTLF